MNRPARRIAAVGSIAAFLATSAVALPANTGTPPGPPSQSGGNGTFVNHCIGPDHPAGVVVINRRLEPPSPHCTAL